MTLQELANMEQFHNFPIADDQIAGVFKRYPFLLSIKTKGNSDIVTISFRLSKNVPGKLQKIIKQGLPNGSSTAIQAGQLIVTIKTQNSSDAYSLAIAALNLVTGTLSSAEKPIHPSDKCPICRRDGCDSAAFAGEMFVPVHRDCVTQQISDETEKANENQLSGSFLTGILGAILGAIVGCIPTILTIFILEREYGLLYILIPLASYKGYKLLKGRSGAGARIIVIICSLVAFIILKPAYYYIYVLSEGYTLSFFEILLFYYFGFSISEILADIWFGALFLIIGIVSSFKMLGTTNDDIIRSAAVRESSIVSLSGSYLNSSDNNVIK